jgi:alpha-tubulin suppressor-like RCC1 family protein
LVGQLGDGTTVGRLSPPSVDIPNLGNTTIVSAGANHSCAISSNELRCWGANKYGQLGDGSTTDRLSPGPAILDAVTAASADNGYSCAIVSGAMRCWGHNFSGELGDGTTMGRWSPGSNISGLGTVSLIGTGSVHACAVDVDEGGMHCWGDNTYGQLGDGTTTGHTRPGVAVLKGVKAIGLAFEDHHTCAVTSNGNVRCWGSNELGQLGDGTTSNRALPDGPDVVQGAKALAAGFQYTCALLEAGTVKCWGRDYGATPVEVSTFCP